MAAIAPLKNVTMCSLPAQPKLVPEPVVREIEEQEPEPLTYHPACEMPVNHFKPIVRKAAAQAIRVSCESELHTRAHELVAYYKLQSETMQHVLDDHASEVELRTVAEDERDQFKSEAEEAKEKAHKLEAALAKITAVASALETRAHTAEKKVETTEKELHHTKDKLHELGQTLHHTEEKVHKLGQTLHQTEGKLHHAHEELHKAEERLTKMRTERDTAKTQLESTKKQFQTAEKALDATKQELESAKRELSSTQDDCKALEICLAKARNDDTFHEGQEHQLRELLKNANAGQDKANDKVTQLSSELAALEKVKDVAVGAKLALEAELHQLKNAQAPPLKSWIHNAKRQNGKYYIDYIEYGGEIIRDPAVYKHMLELAVKGEKFTINNKIMGGDPWPHWTKTCTIAYTVGGQGPFRYITGWEKSEHTFDRS